MVAASFPDAVEKPDDGDQNGNFAMYIVSEISPTGNGALAVTGTESKKIPEPAVPVSGWQKQDQVFSLEPISQVTQAPSAASTRPAISSGMENPLSASAE